MIFADDAIKIDERLFLFANNLNMLFSINISNGELTFLGSIPEEHILSKRLTCKLVYLKNYIIVVPLLAHKIWLYSLENEEWKSIAIKDYRVNEQGTYFRQAILHKDSLFFIGGHYRAILKLDLSSFEITYLIKPFLDRPKFEESEELYFRGDFVYKENIIYLASGRDNTVLMYNLDTNMYKWIEIGKRENRYSGIMWDGNNYWISPRKNTPIVKWDGEDKIKEYEIPKEKRVNGIAYAGVVKRNNQVIIPALATSGADTIILMSDGTIEFEGKEYMFYKKIEKDNYLAQDSDGQILLINEKGIKRRYKCELSKEKLLALLDIARIDIKDIVEIKNSENDPFSLSSLLILMKKVNVHSIQNKKNDGLKIWKGVKL